MVPKAGVEPARRKAQPPQDCVSANSTTSALFHTLGKEYRGLKPSPCLRSFSTSEFGSRA